MERPAAQTLFLLGDIGGTNARFALARGGVISGFAALPVADHPDFSAALDAYLAGLSGVEMPQALLLAVAGPVTGNSCRLTNSGWLVDGPALSAMRGGARVELVNDLEAVAWALPDLTGKDCLDLSAGEAMAGQPRLVVAPGTGLGVAAMLEDRGRLMVIASEGGHAGLAPQTAEEDALLQQLRRHPENASGHVSAERLLSGDGLEAICQALAAMNGRPQPFSTAAAITAAALAGSCDLSRRALEHFCALLGSFAGDLALIFGARGGVYIGGGIAPRIAEFLATSEFQARFTAKGRMRAYLAPVPTKLILRPDAALAGLLARAAQRESGA